MISDRKANKIYFSEIIKTDPRFSECTDQILSILNSFGAEYDFLPKTKDIWARDYMPIQISDNKFIEYRYDPDYLQGKWKGYRNLKSYPDIICDSIGLKTEKSDLILDGGNLVKSDDCIILTDKIVLENRFSYSKTDLVKKLYEMFKVRKVVIIPWDIKERYGHSDGVLRFVDNETVLISDTYRNDNVLKYRLKQAGLKTEFLEFKVKKQDKRNWAYINFLQTKDLILLPKFNIDEDIQSLDQISNFYPDYANNKKILQVLMPEIVKLGGALNCITWTIKN